MGAPKHVKQISKDINGETDNNIINTVTVRDVNTLLTSTERSSRQKITKATMVLNGILNQVDLLDSWQYTPTKTSGIHILFKCTWNILQDISHTRPENKCKQI